MSTANNSAWQAMLVKTAGACCAVGYTLAAASCAIRAGMDNFQESDFVDHENEPLKVARLPYDNDWGTERLAVIAKKALKDCLKTVQDFQPAQTAMILMAAEQGRPHTATERYNEIWYACTADFTEPFHPSSAINPQGRAGIGSALKLAQKLLTERTVQRVLILGVDSFLNSATISHYLAAERLLTLANSDGFIPGEGAGAILLELPQAGGVGLHITGGAISKEEAIFPGGKPNLAIGLTQAMRQACEAANIRPSELKFRMSDQNGEQYFAKEMANAYTRLMADENVFLPMMHIADCVGETGAAVAVLSIAFQKTVMPRADGPGRVGLLHFGNDNGLRAALILRYLGA